MYRWEVPKVLARRLAKIRDRTGVPVARQLRRAVDEYLDQHDAPVAPPARRGPSPSSPPHEEGIRDEQHQPLHVARARDA